MHAAILYGLDAAAADGPLSDRLGDGLPAAAVSSTAYLDGHRIYDGTVAGRVSGERDEPVIGDDQISTTTVEYQRPVTAAIYADLGAGWAGVASSDGGSLLRWYLRAETGVRPHEVEIDLVGLAEGLPDSAEVRGVVYSQSIDDGHRRDAAGARWHDDASQSRVPSEGLSALAVRYSWAGQPVDAMLAASGYVAAYNDAWGVSRFGRWVADEVQPHLSPTDEDQERLPTGADSEVRADE